MWQTPQGWRKSDPAMVDDSSKTENVVEAEECMYVAEEVGMHGTSRD